MVGSRRMSVLIMAQDDLGNPLVILMWWTLAEVLQDEPLLVDVRIHSRARKEVVDVQDAH